MREAKVPTGKGKGKGRKAKERRERTRTARREKGAVGATAHQVLQQLVPVLAKLDRKVGALDDRSSIVFICKNED